ncbi:MAG: RICIN domain-containing protein [Deltaproteobacteria bacterium]
MKRNILTSLALCLPLLNAACGAEPLEATADQGDGADLGSSSDLDSASPFGSAAQAVAACAGDDLQYDFNAFAASLAVASAAELGRWEAITDFEVRYGKLELSTTGELHCGTGCSNIRALLRLQDDAASGVPYHSPSVFRSKLTGWYGQQKTQLTSLVDKMLTMDKGIFRFKNQATGKYLMVDNGSTSDYALIEQRTTPPYSGADQWRVVLDHTMHKLINVRSGKCMELTQDTTSDNIALVQRTCSASALQRFGFATTDSMHVIRTKTGQVLDVKYSSMYDDAPIVQFGWITSDKSQQWALESVGPTIAPEVLSNAMYTISMKRSGKYIGVDNGSLADGAFAEQYDYSPSNDRFQWFIARSGGNGYNIINRKSGKCLDLQSASATSRLVQRTCTSGVSQNFAPATAGDGQYVLYSSYGKALEIEWSSTYNDALLTQGADGTWNDNRLLTLTPVLAGEPHRLTFSHATDDGPCGRYFWYDIAKPNGELLSSPSESFVQLIFAGGKTTKTGADTNPFIAQLVSGNQVAIDPSGYMISGTSSTSGSCVQTDLLYDATRTAGGACCIKYNGVTGRFVQSSWSTTTYLCQ